MRHARQHGKFASGDRSPSTDDNSVTTDISSPLSAASTDELIYILEEEKLAGDIYEAFAELYDVQIFDRIGASEDRHFDAVLT